MKGNVTRMSDEYAVVVKNRSGHKTQKRELLMVSITNSLFPRLPNDMQNTRL